MAGFEEIMRDIPQLGNLDCYKDNLHREDPENLNNLYGCSVEMDNPSWGQRRLPATRYPDIFKYCDGKRNKIRWLKVHITIRKEKPSWCAA